MSQAGPLVVVHEDLPWSVARKRPLAPAGTSVVCLLGSGQLVLAEQQSALFRFRRQYDVDISQHFDTEQLELPARDDAFRFQGTMDVTWGVTDPTQVVKRNVADGLALVRSALLQRMWAISRLYQVEQCAAADAEINRQLGGGPVALPEGITVFRFSIRLTLDEQTRNYLQQQRNHGYETAHSLRQMELTRRSLAGENGLLVMHLTQHRDDTASIIQMLENERATNESRCIELFRELIDKGLIQDVDLDGFTRSLVQQRTLALGTPSGLPQIGAVTGASAVITPAAQPMPITAAPVQATDPFSAQGQATAPHAVADPPQSAKASVPPKGGVTKWKPVGKSQ